MDNCNIAKRKNRAYMRFSGDALATVPPNFDLYIRESTKENRSYAII